MTTTTEDPTLATSPLTMIGRPLGYIGAQYGGQLDHWSRTVDEKIDVVNKPPVKLYLAGPMRGYKDSNFPAFLRTAQDLRDFGYQVFSPAEHDIENGFDYTDPEAEKDFNLRAALGDDLDYITQTADGVALLPGWENSRGALAEVATALALDLRVALAEDWLQIDVEPFLIHELPTARRSGQGALDKFSFGEFVGRGYKDADSITINTAPPFAPPQDTEIRVTSETGGMKGKKLAQIGSMDVMPLLELGKVAGFGAQKYAAYNYLKGYEWSLSYNACLRHLVAFWMGEDRDPESGLPHLAHAMWHCSAMLSFSIRGLGTDDRYVQDALEGL